jgi:biotin carboxyl carrier protein
MSVYSITIKGQSYKVYLKGRRGAALSFSIDDKEYTIPVDSAQHAALKDVSIAYIPKGAARTSSQGSAVAVAPEVKAPLPGIISDVKVKEGDTVAAGATLVVIEAMKMENPIKAPAEVLVTKVHVHKGQEIAYGAVLVSIEPA